ncbi:MAG: HK97-gp10 family putative phage morphogenesis protein [Acinetobacter pittii]
METSVEFTGVEELSRKLDLLADPKIARRIARKAARQGMNIVRDSARQRAKLIDDPETRERIWKNIITSGGKTKDLNTIVMRVGIRGGAAMNAKSDRQALAGLSGGNTTYWRMIEFGNSHQPAVPFMRPALAENIDAVTNKFSNVFIEEIDKELAKK